MGAIKKVIVLSDKSSNGGMALLTMHKSSGNVFGTLKNHNLHIKETTLLISVNDKQVFKQNIDFTDKVTHSFKLENNFSLDAKIACVLVEKNKNQVLPLAWGVSGGMGESQKQLVINSLEALLIKMQEVNTHTSINAGIELKRLDNKTEDKESYIYDKYNKQPQENKKEKDEFKLFDGNNFTHANHLNDYVTDKILAVNKNESILKNASVKHKVESIGEYKLHDLNHADNSSSMQEVDEKLLALKNTAESQAKLYEYTDEEIEQEIDDAIGFYELIKDQVDELFKKHPAEENLEQLIPDSKWVKVDFEGDGNHYVIGLIYEEKELKFICYGVPGEYDKEPPGELAKYSQWLPLDENIHEGNGYWLMYQDAQSGDSVKLEIV